MTLIICNIQSSTNSAEEKRSVGVVYPLPDKIKGVGNLKELWEIFSYVQLLVKPIICLNWV